MHILLQVCLSVFLFICLLCFVSFLGWHVSLRFVSVSFLTLQRPILSYKKPSDCFEMLAAGGESIHFKNKIKTDQTYGYNLLARANCLLIRGFDLFVLPSTKGGRIRENRSTIKLPHTPVPLSSFESWGLHNKCWS